MTTSSKKVPAINATITGDTGEFSRLTLEFAHGKKLELSMDELSEVILRHATMHGLKQKLVDAAAISRNALTGQSATIEDKYEAVKAVYDRIIGEAGEWNATREGGALTGGLLLKALVRLYEDRKTVEQLREFLEGKTPAEKAALRKNPKIATIIEEIRAEKAGADGIDTDELLDELDD